MYLMLQVNVDLNKYILFYVDIILQDVPGWSGLIGLAMRRHEASHVWIRKKHNNKLNTILHKKYLHKKG